MGKENGTCIVTKCCCCVELLCGVKILGWFDVISLVLNVFMLILGAVIGMHLKIALFAEDWITGLA
jgi:hypothetical protein